VFLLYATLLVFAVLILALDLLAAAALTIALARAIPLAVRGTQTTGYVTGIDRPRRRGARVRISYETAAGKLETRGTSRRPRLGEPKPVRYDPANPARATSMVQPARAAAIGVPATLAVAALAVAMAAGSILYFTGTDSRLQLPLAFGGFALALAVGTAYYACGQYAALLRWRRMVQTTGRVKRFEEHGPGGPGILIYFESAAGHEDFWARAGSVSAGVGDTVTVYYDPAKPERTATVEAADVVRAHAIAGTLLAAVLAVVAVAALSQL
jgi:hypothetical protein